MTFPPVILGMLISAFCFLMFTCFDTVTKFAAQRLSIYTCMVVIFITALLCILGYTAVTKRGKFLAEITPKKWSWLWARAGANIIGQALFFTAFAHMPLTEFYIVIFMIPLFTALMAGFMLKETISPTLIGAIIISFAGVLIALLPAREAGDGLSMWHIVVFIGTFFSASTNLSLKKIMQTETQSTTACHMLVCSIVAYLIPASFDFVLPTFAEIGLLMLGGVFYGLAAMLLPLAYKLAPASLASIPNFLQLIYGAIAGFLVFGFVPPIWTYIGGSIVIAANLFVMFRHKKA